MAQAFSNENETHAGIRLAVHEIRRVGLAAVGLSKTIRVPYKEQPIETHIRETKQAIADGKIPDPYPNRRRTRDF